MDVSSIASLATDMQSTRLQEAVATTVLKKALDNQSAVAAQLLAALPQPVPGASNLPANLGQNVNTTA